MATTREIAEFVTKTTYESLPAEVIHEAKRDIINVLGVALGYALYRLVTLLLPHDPRVQPAS